ncbi:MAG: hypothetical protein LBP33_02500 [Candidatus Adiutrix sp.]|nr:hypothetical protein [Candidatus Adiutrix sp.]
MLLKGVKILKRSGWLWAFLLLAATGGCLGGPARPSAFHTPLESRLIVGVPFYAEETGGGAASALASVLSFYGRESSPGTLIEALGRRPPAPWLLVLQARRRDLAAELKNGLPDDLLAAVRGGRPLIIRLGAAAEFLKAGDYAVFLGYTPEGPVLNSGSAQQRVLSWSDFLAAWQQAGNPMINIRPSLPAGPETPGLPGADWTGE